MSLNTDSTESDSPVEANSRCSRALRAHTPSTFTELPSGLRLSDRTCVSTPNGSVPRAMSRITLWTPPKLSGANVLKKCRTRIVVLFDACPIGQCVPQFRCRCQRGDVFPRHPIRTCDPIATLPCRGFDFWRSWSAAGPPLHPEPSWRTRHADQEPRFRTPRRDHRLAPRHPRKPRNHVRHLPHLGAG